MNKAVANFCFKHSEESLFYLQATFTVEHMLCAALLLCIKRSLRSWLFLQPFMSWLLPYVQGILQPSVVRGQAVWECIFIASPSPPLMYVPLAGDFLQIIGSGSKLSCKDTRNVIFRSGLSHQIISWALELIERKEKTWEKKAAF